MKITLFFLVSVLFLSCNMDSNGSAPVLKKVVIAPTQAMIDAAIDATEFTTTDFIRFHYTVTDKDGDYDMGVISIIDENGEIVEIDKDPCKVFFSGTKNTEYSITHIYNQGKFAVGSWSISVYYVDKAGNKSETVTKNFIVSNTD